MSATATSSYHSTASRSASCINRAGFGTYSVLAFFIGFLGAGPFYLTFEREHTGAHGS
jgi:hypothetical protein